MSKDFTVAFSEYLSKLTENQSLRLTVAVKVVETSKTFSDEKDFEIETPESSVIEVRLEASRALSLCERYRF